MPRRRRRARKGRRKTVAKYVPRTPSSNVVSLKFRWVGDLTTNVGGLMTGTINPNSLTRFWHDSAGNYESLLEVQNAINLFDLYRVRAVKIEATPKFAQSEYLKLAGGDNVLAPNPNSVMCYDVDNTGRLANFNAMVTRDQKHQFSVFRKLKHYQPIAKAKQSAAGSATFSMAGGWNNLQSESDNLQGIIDFQSDETFKINGAPTTTYQNGPLMNMVVTAYVQFKFRQ